MENKNFILSNGKWLLRISFSDKNDIYEYFGSKAEGEEIFNKIINDISSC